MSKVRRKPSACPSMVKHLPPKNKNEMMTLILGLSLKKTNIRNEIWRYGQPSNAIRHANEIKINE